MFFRRDNFAGRVSGGEQKQGLTRLGGYPGFSDVSKGRRQLEGGRTWGVENRYRKVLVRVIGKREGRGIGKGGEGSTLKGIGEAEKKALGIIRDKG